MITGSKDVAVGKLRYSGFHPLKAEAVVAQRPPGPCRRTQSWLETGSPVTADGVSDPQERDFHRKATLLRGRPSLEALWGKRRLCGRSCLLGYGTKVVPAGPGGQREGGRRQHERRILPRVPDGSCRTRGLRLPSHAQPV